MRIYLVLLVITIGSLGLFQTSCKKTVLFSSNHLSFSQDTVVFDTVFTTIGSTTKQLKLYNNDGRTVRIDRVELMGGSSSPFRINLDGLSGTQFSGIELEGKDSLYCFVEVTLDPNGGNLPMVVEDSILFRTNGKDQYVILAAWGQDVYYHYSDLSGQTGQLDLNEGTWPNDKPHLIYGAAFIDEGKTLTIPAGTQIHLHKNSFLYCYKGTLNIEGQLGNEVVIQGDRLEADYDDVSGQYYGVYLDSALTSTINYAIIKNGTTGIHIEGDGANGGNYTAIVKNTIIENHARYGILNFYGARVFAENCLIYKNGFHAFFNLAGSQFYFNHCDLLGYSNSGEQLPAVGISNYYQGDVFGMDGYIHNTVIYGFNDDELGIDTANITGADPMVDINYCILKQSSNQTNFALGMNIGRNLDPQFKSVEENDFEFWVASPLQGGGDASVFTDGNLDIRQVFRMGPDIGAIERL